jgi:hypothetical protein
MLFSVTRTAFDAQQVELPLASMYAVRTAMSSGGLQQG